VGRAGQAVSEADDEFAEVLRRWTEAGLFDAEHENAAEIRSLIEFYAGIGVDPSDHTGGGKDLDDISFSVNQRMLRPGPRLSRDDVRLRAGLDDESFDRICKAVGYRPDDEFTELDAEAFAGFAVGEALFSDDELVHFSRVLARAMGQVAEASASLFGIDVGVEIDAVGGSRLEFAKSNALAAGLIDQLMLAAKAFLLRSIEEAAGRGDLGRERALSGALSAVTMAVGFVDLVGFTPMSLALDLDGVSRLITDFEARATEAVRDHSGHLVKLIGDEVMFVSNDPDSCVAIARTLINPFGAEGSAPHGGVAYGDVVSRDGDYYGPVVNLASRMTSVADSGQVVVDAATASEIGQERFVSIGARALKGFPEPIELFVAR
jgi:adenylate cyclase